MALRTDTTTPGRWARPSALLLGALLALGGCGTFQVGVDPPATAPPAPLVTAVASPSATATLAPVGAPAKPTGSGPTATAPVGGAATTTPLPPAGRPIPPGTDVGTIGERRERAGLALTVKGVSGAATIDDIAADAGKVYLVLDVVIENQSQKALFYSTDHFHLVDDGGNRYPYTATIAPEPRLKLYDTLDRGASVRGKFSFEVPMTNEELVVSFEPDNAPPGYTPLRIALGEASAYAPAGANTPPTVNAPRPTATIAPTVAATKPPVAATAPPTGGARPTPTVPTARPTHSVPGDANGWGSALAPLTGGKPYADPRGRFSFRIPTGWTPSTAAGAEVAFVDDNTGAVVGVTLEDLSSNPGTTLESYDRSAEAGLKRQFPDYATLSLDKVTIDGHPAYRRVGHLTTQGVSFQLTQYYLIDGGTAHIVSGGALFDPSPDQAATFDQIAGSYRVGTGAHDPSGPTGSLSASAFLAVVRRETL